MGKVINKILNWIGVEEDVVESDNDFQEDDSQQDEELIESNFKSKNKKGKVFNIHTPSYIKVVVYQPLTYDDTQNIIDNLKNRKPIVVNLDALDKDLAQRVLDFMSGAAYALDGTIQKVSKSIFVLVPSNVEIIGNIPDDLKGKSFYTLGNNYDED